MLFVIDYFMYPRFKDYISNIFCILLYYWLLSRNAGLADNFVTTVVVCWKEVVECRVYSDEP